MERLTRLRAAADLGRQHQAMPIPERFTLWPNDSALNAVDRVSAEICSHIDDAIDDCDQSDCCSLNDIIAYMCCLSAVASSYSGLTAQYSRVETWRTKVLQIFEWAWTLDQGHQEYQKKQAYLEEKEYVYSVLNSLFEAVDSYTIPNAREPWKRC
jgi:hypothetical protein